MFNLAVAKAKAGCLKEALNCFRQAEKQNSDHQLLRVNIITILKDLNEINEAWKELRGLKPSMRSCQNVRAVQASLLIANENYAEASVLLRDLTEENPQSEKHWINWIIVCAMKYTDTKENPQYRSSVAP